MELEVEEDSKPAKLADLADFMSFFAKTAITQLGKVQIQKSWCLKSSTCQCPSIQIIYSIQKVKKLEQEGKEDSKPAKKIKIAITPNFSKV